MTLVEVLEAAAAAAGAERATEGSTTVWSISGRPFAAAGADGAEFRLKPIVARAALGTPDTSASRRGGAWIAFRPPELDRFAIDRATAWFASAAGFAAEPRG